MLTNVRTATIKLTRDTQTQSITMATRKRPDTLKVPDAWQADFRGATMKTNFVLALSQSMIEFLSAVSDGVHWDRATYVTIHAPDNWVATGDALIRRGLVVRKSRAEIDAERKQRDEGDWREYTNYRLTPAGAALIELFKVTGLFVQSDNGAKRKAR